MPCQTSSIFTDIAPIITWLLVIIGWIVVNKQNNVRVSRGEIRSSLDVLEDQIRELESAAIQYHIEDHSPLVSRNIRIRLTLVAHTVQSIGRSMSKSFAHEVYMYRNAITLRNFDTADHKRLNMDDEILDNIGAQTSNLIMSLEDGYSERYHQTSGWRAWVE